MSDQLPGFKKPWPWPPTHIRPPIGPGPMPAVLCGRKDAYPVCSTRHVATPSVWEDHFCPACLAAWKETD